MSLIAMRDQGNLTQRIRRLLGTVHGGIESLTDFRQRLKYSPKIIPPRHLRRAGKEVGDYVAGGKWMVEWCRRFAGLNSGSNLLDVGCGDGRFASALIDVLEGGTYSTFEVNAQYVEFLRNRISKHNRNFTFVHADLYHSYYNPKGAHNTADYVFPFPNEQFDIVFLNSIFTHFLPDEITHYLAEIRRVLKDDGVVFATYFITNNESLEMDRQGLSSSDLTLGCSNLMNYRFDNHWTRDQDVKEYIVGIDEKWLRQVYIKEGLEVSHVIWGTWCGRQQTADNTQQDIIVARKRR